MQYGSTVLAAEPVNGVTCGIDWARDDHAVAIVDASGREVHRSTIEHSSAGLLTLVGLLTHAGVVEVAVGAAAGVDELDVELLLELLPHAAARRASGTISSAADLLTS